MQNDKEIIFRYSYSSPKKEEYIVLSQEDIEKILYKSKRDFVLLVTFSIIISCGIFLFLTKY